MFFPYRHPALKGLGKIKVQAASGFDRARVHGRTFMGHLVLKASIGALLIRIGFWGPLYYNYTREPPQNSIGNRLRPLY